MKMYPIFQSGLMIDLSRETDGYNETCLGVRFALCITFCTFKGFLHRTDSVCVFIGVRLRQVGKKVKTSPTFRSFKPLNELSPWSTACQSISECGAGKRMRPIKYEQTDKHYCFVDIDMYASWPARRCPGIRASPDWLTSEKICQGRGGYISQFCRSSYKEQVFNQATSFSKLCEICVNQSSFLDPEICGSQNRVHGHRKQPRFSCAWIRCQECAYACGNFYVCAFTSVAKNSLTLAEIFTHAHLLDFKNCNSWAALFFIQYIKDNPTGHEVLIEGFSRPRIACSSRAQRAEPRGPRPISATSTVASCC